MKVFAACRTPPPPSFSHKQKVSLDRVPGAKSKTPHLRSRNMYENKGRQKVPGMRREGTIRPRLACRGTDERTQREIDVRTRNVYEDKAGEQGVRCQVRGVRAPNPVPKSKTRGCRRHRQKSTYQAGMSMKTKGSQKQKSGDSSKPAGLGGAGSWCQEMKVQPEMLLKTKGRKNELAPTSAISGGSIGALPQSGILAPDSWLLNLKYAGASGDVDENKGRRKNSSAIMPCLGPASMAAAWPCADAPVTG